MAGSRAAETTTAETDADVDAFLAAVQPEARRRDALVLRALMERVTGQPARMWGPSIVGFGRYRYRYPSGREGEMAAASFSPRKASSSVYVVDGFEAYADELARLGPHTTGAACLYLKRLDDVDLGVLEDIVRRSYAAVTAETFGSRAS